MSPRLRGYSRVSITMLSRILKGIDNLADEVELSRSEVISDLCEHCLRDEKIIDKIYPYEEEDEEG
jgi:metal-responsive CopG/Arc/MetJ family transcriptional regulator